MKKLFLIATLFSLLFPSCKKNESTWSDIDYDAFIQCQESQQWDSAKIATQLTGSWKLYAMSCAWTGKKDVDTMDVQVNFDSLGNFSVLQHSIVHSQGTWSVNLSDSTCELALSTHEQFIEGAILLCPDQVCFSESSVDLCDKAYNRIK